MNLDGKSNKLLDDAVMQFASLPGIGKKTAMRFVLHLLKKSDEEVKMFTESINKMKLDTRFCSLCNNISDDKICNICSDKSRNNNMICVVEGIKDIIAIESTSQYRGLYHVLGGVISPMEGIGPNDINVMSLIDRLKDNTTDEVILALPTTMEGDTTNFFINKKISNFNVKVSILSRGVAVGDELQYTDEITLGQSIINRKPFLNNV